MSSPPSLPSTSPPYPATNSLPSKKRGGTGPVGSNKRRKASIASTSSLHPLRQTSFPPEEAARGALSPSVSSSVTAATAPTGRKRGRPSNDAKQRQNNTTGRNTAASSVVGTARPPTDALADEEEEEDDGDADAEADAAANLLGIPNAAEEQQERQKLRFVSIHWSPSAILVESFTEEQNDRYDVWRRAKLNPAAVKRRPGLVFGIQLANHTLNQSIPDPVVKALNGLTKIFIAEMVEKARDVQEQWEAVEPPSANHGPAAADEDGTPLQKGILMPDHIREAYRRYRKDGEGGGVGTRSGRTGGRQLFR
ncbi:MAG: hypothetical protein M1825_005945 [Sarcosagium campestre]|nr:MAG: hypothetical protein M1825_005945 [Sarcosagium campestre]